MSVLNFMRDNSKKLASSLLGSVALPFALNAAVPNNNLNNNYYHLHLVFFLIRSLTFFGLTVPTNGAAMF